MSPHALALLVLFTALLAPSAGAERAWRRDEVPVGRPQETAIAPPELRCAGQIEESPTGLRLDLSLHHVQTIQRLQSYKLVQRRGLRRRTLSLDERITSHEEPPVPAPDQDVQLKAVPASVGLQPAAHDAVVGSGRSDAQGLLVLDLDFQETGWVPMELQVWVGQQPLPGVLDLRHSALFTKDRLYVLRSLLERDRVAEARAAAADPQLPASLSERMWSEYCAGVTPMMPGLVEIGGTQAVGRLLEGAPLGNEHCTDAWNAYAMDAEPMIRLLASAGEVDEARWVLSILPDEHLAKSSLRMLFQDQMRTACPRFSDQAMARWQAALESADPQAEAAARAAYRQVIRLKEADDGLQAAARAESDQALLLHQRGQITRQEAELRLDAVRSAREVSWDVQLAMGYAEAAALSVVAASVCEGGRSPAPDAPPCHVASAALRRSVDALQIKGVNETSPDGFFDGAVTHARRVARLADSSVFRSMPLDRGVRSAFVGAAEDAEQAALEAFVAFRVAALARSGLSCARGSDLGSTAGLAQQLDELVPGGRFDGLVFSSRAAWKACQAASGQD